MKDILQAYNELTTKSKAFVKIFKGKCTPEAECSLQHMDNALTTRMKFGL